MSEEQFNMYARYEKYMRMVDPETYGALFFDYEKKTWVARLVSSEPPKKWKRPKQAKPQAKKKRKASHKLDVEIRESVLTRDGNRCVKCGSEGDLNIHHKIRRKAGGTDEPDNLITLCEICHALEHKGEHVYKVMRKNLADKGIDLPA